MGYFGKNVIVGSLWLLIIFLIITTQTSQLFLSMLFTVFVLSFSADISDKYITKDGNIKSFLSFFISFIIFTGVGAMLYFSIHYMAKDLNDLLYRSQPIIIDNLKSYGIEEIETISQIYDKILEYFKSNINVITTSLGLLTKVLIGVIFGLIFHFNKVDAKANTNLEGRVINDISYYSHKIFVSFKNLMEIQVLVSLMNTTIVSFMALALTPIINDNNFLPYWYVIIPLTAILSLIPVVGNVLINILLILGTIQVSIWWVVFGVGMFIGIHKLELILIGSKIKEKVGLPFGYILTSMLLGELLFHSMSGMLLGMVILLTITNIMRKVPYKEDYKIIQP